VETEVGDEVVEIDLCQIHKQEDLLASDLIFVQLDYVWVVEGSVDFNLPLQGVFVVFCDGYFLESEVPGGIW